MVVAPLRTKPYADNASHESHESHESQLVTHSLTKRYDSSEDGTGRDVPLTMAFDTKASGRNGFGVGDHSPTLRAMNGKRLNGGGQIGVFQQNSRSEVRFIDGDGQITGSVTSEPGAQQQNYLAGHGVRRLTPRECERLQGFPDDWTLIPWRGKMAPDGPRYKAIGNSMAVPVMRWIGERIATIEAIL